MKDHSERVIEVVIMEKKGRQGKREDKMKEG